MPSFGPVYTVEPRPGHPHTHTAVLLHGRGSTGEEFADELFGTALSNPQTPSLADCLPSWRWVFPSAPSTWNATFEEWMPAWFEAHSLADPTARQDLQQPGLQASVQHVWDIMGHERQRLGEVGEAREAASLADAHADSRLVLGGISLGGAVALWCLLGTDAPMRPLGGFVAVSTWLPFAEDIRRCLYMPQVEDGPLALPALVQRLTAPLRQHLQLQKAAAGDADTSVLTTPVFLGHGRDDAYVDVQLGQQVRQLLADAGFASVEWHDYEGAEQEGHWLKEPEEMDDLARFLATVGGPSRGM
ncbi:hypothetical protein SCUCBS95973_002551 [Sporothrix curviconia]|uniref:Phospholipase/carboxylesterase/thioesterase domain-containing protein n=1 Tax=Sporothrix curviconia TaxID=1260050 RepID=A0ABP0B7Z1_9PEZI